MAEPSSVAVAASTNYWTNALQSTSSAATSGCNNQLVTTTHLPNVQVQTRSGQNDCQPKLNITNCPSDIKNFYDPRLIVPSTTAAIHPSTTSTFLTYPAVQAHDYMKNMLDAAAAQWANDSAR